MKVRVTPPARQIDAGTDIFSNKVGQWAFSTPFASFKNAIYECLGRFGIVPMDGTALDYLEECVAPAHDLPTSHSYDSALRQALQACQAYPQACAVLQRDIEAREYYFARKMEQVLS